MICQWRPESTSAVADQRLRGFRRSARVCLRRSAARRGWIWSVSRTGHSEPHRLQHQVSTTRSPFSVCSKRTDPACLHLLQLAGTFNKGRVDTEPTLPCTDELGRGSECTSCAGPRISVHDITRSSCGCPGVAGRSAGASADVRCAEQSSEAGSAGNGIRRRPDLPVLRLRTDVDPRDHHREVQRLSFVRAWCGARPRPPQPINDDSADDGRRACGGDRGVPQDIDCALNGRAVAQGAGSTPAGHKRATPGGPAPLRAARLSADGRWCQASSRRAHNVVAARTSCLENASRQAAAATAGRCS
jgi:hypothetical protein